MPSEPAGSGTLEEHPEHYNGHSIHSEDESRVQLLKMTNPMVFCDLHCHIMQESSRCDVMNIFRDRRQCVPIFHRSQSFSSVLKWKKNSQPLDLNFTES